MSKSLTELTKNIALKPKIILGWEEVVNKFYLQVNRKLKIMTSNKNKILFLVFSYLNLLIFDNY